MLFLLLLLLVLSSFSSFVCLVFFCQFSFSEKKSELAIDKKAAPFTFSPKFLDNILKSTDSQSLLDVFKSPKITSDLYSSRSMYKRSNQFWIKKSSTWSKSFSQLIHFLVLIFILGWYQMGGFCMSRKKVESHLQSEQES